jgi:hypothetical protein
MEPVAAHDGSEKAKLRLHGEIEMLAMEERPGALPTWPLSSLQTGNLDRSEAALLLIAEARFGKIASNSETDRLRGRGLRAQEVDPAVAR